MGSPRRRVAEAVVNSDTPASSLLGVPSPAEWLSDTIAQCGIAQARVARLLGVQPAQVSHWLHGKEAIPPYHLSAFAHIVVPIAVNYVRQICSLDEVVKHLGDRCEAFEISVGDASGTKPDGPGKATFSELVRLIGELVDADVYASASERAERAIQYVHDCVFSLRALLASYSEGFCGVPLVAPDDLMVHLRHPVNVFVGFLLGTRLTNAAGGGLREGLGALREGCLNHLRARYRQGQRSTAPLEVLRHQHELHLLARYGERSDVSRIAAEVIGRIRVADPLTRKVAYTGVILSTGDGEIAERFAAELLRDAALANANRAFDAYHYGDVAGATQPQIWSPDTFPNTIRHFVRRLRSRKNYAALDSVLAVALVQIIRMSSSLEDLPLQIRNDVAEVLTKFIQTFDGDETIRRELNGILPSVRSIAEPREGASSALLSARDGTIDRAED